MFLYLPHETPFHRLHPSTKTVGLALLLVMTVAFISPWQQMTILLFVFSMAWYSKSLRNLRRILPLVITIMVFSCVTWSLFKRVGDPFWIFGPLSLSRESIEYGLAMGFRLDAMLLSGMIFVSCTKVEEFAYGLRALGLPFPVSFAMSLAFRLVPLFFTRIGIIVQAQQSRGLDIHSGNIFQRLRKYVPLLIPIFVYAIRDTDLLSMALESKGFGMQGKRTEFLSFRFKRADVIVLCALVTANVMAWLL